MTPRQFNELNRQADVVVTRVQRFIELQAQINNQIDTRGEADGELADELALLGDQLTRDEINQLYVHYQENNTVGEKVEDDIEWDDVEWINPWAK